MKAVLLSLIILFYFICCNNSHPHAAKQTDLKSIKNMSDSTFEYHFHILDSASAANPLDTICTCCTRSIKFMEVNSGISANSDGTLLGKLSFSKEDLKKWHDWYDKLKNKENLER